ncbi:hypothetical protein CASFOL_003864 [Castilleja foliolosa]|uniref:Uncharacterized protein n=1 Tax=Castilleja foliolosa TaxID=1961234 RepID=A0ABD3EIR0_9LAMI
MASLKASTPFSSENSTNDGPVLTLISKRLRALRKKLNRISKMEESLSQGKTLNKEQEETLRSKPSVIAAIDELEKLRQPLSQAVDHEIQLTVDKHNKQKSETLTEDTSSVISDLLGLLYFGSMFDMATLMTARCNMLTRTHERNCCLTYDYVDDDYSSKLLEECDLDLIATMGGLLTSRPLNSCLSHKNSLQKCVEHAKLWLANSDLPIEPNSSTTYASLRELLNKIMASEYFITSPEIRAPVDLAEPVGNYNLFHAPLLHRSSLPPTHLHIPIEGSSASLTKRSNDNGDSSDFDPLASAAGLYTF